MQMWNKLEFKIMISAYSKNNALEKAFYLESPGRNFYWRDLSDL